MYISLIATYAIRDMHISEISFYDISNLIPDITKCIRDIWNYIRDIMKLNSDVHITNMYIS